MGGVPTDLSWRSVSIGTGITGPSSSSRRGQSRNFLKNVVTFYSRTKYQAQVFAKYATDVKEVEIEMDKLAEEKTIAHVAVVAIDDFTSNSDLSLQFLLSV